MNNLAKSLRQLRELKNYSQEYMAVQLRICTRAYSKIETGETQLTVKRLNEVSKILGISPTEIMVFDHEKIFETKPQGGIKNEIPQKLIDQYEQRIQHLEKEIVFLRSLVKSIPEL